jgi:hypothetical protein
MNPTNTKDYRKILRKLILATATVVVCILPTGAAAAAELPVAPQSYGPPGYEPRDVGSQGRPGHPDKHAGNEQPGDGQAGDEEPGDGQAGDEQPGDGQPGDAQADDEQAGDGQAGDEQAGDGQAGDEQAGNNQNGNNQNGNNQDGNNQDGNNQDGDEQADNDQAGDEQAGDEQAGDEQAADNGNGAAGPVADDFVDITTVESNAGENGNGLAANGDSGSTGTFTTSCGTNANNLFNTDNLIVAPGVENGAHHTHDYVGNQGNDAFASNDDLANADTSCQNQGDKSTYYWPVLRQQDGNDEFDADQAGGGAEGNVGTILEATEAEIRFVGNQQSDVVAMPKFLRIITGDAKAFTNGDANANASWSCTGFEDTQLTDKYPICPEGSQVVRTSNFQSCWDGENIDSANHRDHVDFVQADGSCADGFQAIPQLQIRLVYDAQPPTIENGQVQNPFAVDGFPEELHKPITDHNDFINVFDEELMNQMVDCINSGQQCQ